MVDLDWKKHLRAFDERRDIAIPGDDAQTVQFSAEHFLNVGQQAIKEKGSFAVALSGGSTPKAIYERLAQPKNRNRLDWKRVFLFWSDERCVPLDHPDSNYRMAMEAGLAVLPIPEQNIFPMQGEGDLEANAEIYERLITDKLPTGAFDLVMLGMGEDGHTASLFPKTHGLHPNEKLVIVNFIPSKNSWRITLTFDCINAARHIAIYVLGRSKAEMVKRVFLGPYDPDTFPVQRVGTPAHKALWILDRAASAEL